METELLFLFILQTLGSSILGKFAGETPWWKTSLKWIITLGITYLLFINFGHLISLFFLSLLTTVGLIVHFKWCYKNGIDPINATPRKKYYALRKWILIE